MYSEILDSLRRENRFRKIPLHRKGSGILDLCTNDYMGIATDSAIWREEFALRFPDVAMSASASRLLASEQNVYKMFEEFLTKSYGHPALLFNSGYHANVGLVSVLTITGTLWLSDKLIHASVIDGLRMARAEFKRWNHNDVSHLREILRKNHDRYDRLIVLTESIFSMDGNRAPLRELVALKEEFPKVMLYVDEAHAVGVAGPHGLGIAAEEGILDKIDILVGTLGKAVGSAGAFVVTSNELKDYFINTSRSLIFSTALPPVNVAWSMLMMEKLAGMDSERKHLADISIRFRKGIEKITGITSTSESPIVPLMTGDAETAVLLSAELEKSGILALPIRRPTVPPGGERIRFSLNATLTDLDIEWILNEVDKVVKQVIKK